MIAPTRHHLITQILREQHVRSQAELRDVLADRGVPIAQGTLSRDLRSLGVLKGPAGYTLPGTQPIGDAPPNGQHSQTQDEAQTLHSALRAYLISADVADSLVVLRTAPGHAQALAIELDRSPPSGVAGTIAGDDTVFLATFGAPSAEEVRKQLYASAGMLTHYASMPSSLP